MNFVILQHCPYCQRHRSPKEFLRLGTGGARICWRCYQWHQKAVKMLAGQPPPGCQVCGVTFRQLLDAAAGGDTRMYVHAKDGIYQILCKQCSDSYIVAHRVFYKETEFGRRLNLA